MAVVVNTSKNVLGAFTPTKITLATSGDTLTFVSGAGQELILKNTSASPVVVTVDGADGTTVAVPGAGATTVSVVAGLAVTVAANSFAVVRLDTVPAYMQGVVSISAAPGAVIDAIIIQ